MLSLRLRIPERMPTGCYEILVDWTADIRGSEVSPEDLAAGRQLVSQCVLTALREPAPLIRVWGQPLIKPKESGLYWMVLRLLAESSSCDFEPDSPAAARVVIEERLLDAVRVVFPVIGMFNTRIAYRPEMPWL